MPRPSDSGPSDSERRLAALERRVAALEERGAPPTRGDAAPDPFWALSRLETDFPDGALLYAGHVHLPTGEHYAWKETQTAPELLAAEWHGAAPVLAALGHPLRLALLQAVLRGQRTTAAFQANADLAAGGKLYHHLRELQAAGWLALEGRGQYSVPAQRIMPLLVILRATGAALVPESGS